MRAQSIEHFTGGKQTEGKHQKECDCYWHSDEFQQTHHCQDCIHEFFIANRPQRAIYHSCVEVLAAKRRTRNVRILECYCSKYPVEDRLIRQHHAAHRAEHKCRDQNGGDETWIDAANSAHQIFFESAGFEPASADQKSAYVQEAMNGPSAAIQLPARKPKDWLCCLAKFGQPKRMRPNYYQGEAQSDRRKVVDAPQACHFVL
jgi:hypothetical protein